MQEKGNFWIGTMGEKGKILDIEESQNFPERRWFCLLNFVSKASNEIFCMAI